MINLVESIRKGKSYSASSAYAYKKVESLIFLLVTHMYERGSIIITASPIGINSWVRANGLAILDRLLHILDLNGKVTGSGGRIIEN